MCSPSVNTKSSLIALIAIGIISSTDTSRLRRMLGGEDAAPNEFPWMAQLNVTDMFGANHDCGGVIISPRHILTTAHCLEWHLLNSIWTGYYIRDFNIAVKSYAAQIIVHPQYKWILEKHAKYLENDLSIVVLDEDLKLGANQNVIPLAEEEATVGTTAMLSGWGCTDESRNHSSMILQKSPIKIIPKDQCPIQLSEMLCGRSPPQATPCYGDSGSPLVVDGRVVGITTTSFCIRGRETMFISVPHHLAWIKSSIEKPTILNHLERGHF